MDRLTRLERKKNEAEARFRKAQKETKEQERKIRTRCLVLMGSALKSEILKQETGSDYHCELLRILANNLSPDDAKYIEAHNHILIS